MTVHRSANQFLPSLQRSTANVFQPIQREFDRLFGSGAIRGAPAWCRERGRTVFAAQR